MSIEQDMASALETFVAEGRELVQDLETGLLGLEEGGDSETVNALFRAAHTIKGSSGLFGLDHLVRFTHALESVLDRLRVQELAVSSELVGALLPCADHLAAMLAEVAAGRLDEDERSALAGTALLAGLQPFLATAPAGHPGDGYPDAEQPDAEQPGSELWIERSIEPVDGPAGRRPVRIGLAFGPDCLRNGMDPLAFVRYLSTLGDVVEVTTRADGLPDAADFDPESCYLAFEVVLVTDASLADVESVFEFVRDDSRVEVVEVAEASGTASAAGTASPAARGGDARVPAQTRGELSDAAPARPEPEPEPEPRPEPRPEPAAVQAPPADGEHPGHETRKGDRRVADRRVASRRVVDRPASPAAVATPEARSIRIDAGRLDRLIDAVGELVIAGASAQLTASHNRDEALLATLGEVMRLVEEVRDSALNLRMVPIGTTFSRFQRVVRDVSADLGKDIQLVISGGETEVDKALVEQIGDPLMHLVRNAVDHGIEPAEVRAERGKPVRGTVRLNAFHDSGSIVIEQSDDGGGIDVARVLALATERGLVEPGAVLTDQEICELVFEPGFSTKAQVSDLSGRGVGMDVVKRNVTALRGTIDIENHPGEGCTVRIRLPLTLAIIDGFMVAVGGATFVVPLDWVVECVELPVTSDRRDCMDLRGEVLPFIRLRSLFGISGERPRRENVVVVEYAGMKIGLVVDTLMGEFQTVIKPLGRLFEHVRGIGGSTILGNGEVALIIDVPMLIRHHTDRHDVLIGS